MGDCVSRALGGVIGGSFWHDCNSRVQDTQCLSSIGLHCACRRLVDYYWRHFFGKQETLAVDRLLKERIVEAVGDFNVQVSKPRVGEGAAIFHCPGS